MKHSILLSSALLAALGAAAQTEVTVTTGTGNSLQTFYSLENGVQASATLADWDLAFEINALNSSILVNTGKGLKVYETPVAFEDWASLTALDTENWTEIRNSEESWSAGALTHGNNLSQPMGFHMGWGEYSMDTHFVLGDKLYVIDAGSGVYRKLRIDQLVDGIYSFTYADLDGGNEQTAELNKSAFVGKNFGYFSFATGNTLDLEPQAATWDLLFTKYIAMVESLEGPVPYAVAGVLQNKQVLAMQVDSVPTDEAVWNNWELEPSINIIGSDWKRFDMTLFSWVFEDERTYFVQDRGFDIWKLIFTGYSGSGTGNFVFTQERVSSVGVEENAVQQLVVYPNPSRNGVLNMVIGTDVRNGQLTLIDLAGKVVKQQNVNGTGSLSAVPVDLSGVQPGLYVARLDAEGKLFSTRVVVE